MAAFYKDIHEEVQRYFPEFNYSQTSPPAMRSIYCDMSHPNNQVGHQQRAFTCFWAIQCCGPLDLGLDLGSTRGLTPYCVHVDKYATGRANPLYGGTDPVWSDVISDMADLRVFADDCFPYMCSNHSLEHADVARFLPEGVPRYPNPPPYDGPVERDAFERWKREVYAEWKEKVLPPWLADYPKWRDAYDAGVVRMLREEWVRVLRRPIVRHRPEPGGLLALCVPDAAYFNVFDADADHKHSWSHDDFRLRVLDHLLDLVEVLEWDTLQNKYSFNIVMRRK